MQDGTAVRLPKRMHSRNVLPNNTVIVSMKCVTIKHVARRLFVKRVSTTHYKPTYLMALMPIVSYEKKKYSEQQLRRHHSSYAHTLPVVKSAESLQIFVRLRTGISWLPGMLPRDWHKNQCLQSLTTLI